MFVLTVCLQDAPAPSAHVMFCILPVFFFFMSSLQLRPQPRKQSVSPSWNLVPVLEALPPCFFTCQKHTGEPVPRASQSVGWLVGGSVVQDQPWNRLNTVQAEKPSRMMLFCADGFPAGWTERLFPTDLGAEE